jgi:hypothetical protein
MGAGTGEINDISINTSRIISNFNHGILHTYGTNFRVSQCTIAGNGQQTSNTYDGIQVAAGISDFYITSNKIGTAGTAPTPQQRFGVNVLAGASDRYKITDNDVNGNITPPYITDAGTGVNKDVSGNIPGPQSAGGINAPQTAAVALTANALEQVCLATTVAANSLLPGTVIRLVAVGTATQTAAITTSTLRVRIGAVGSGIGGVIAATAASASPAVIRTTVGFWWEAIITIYSIGAGGTAIGNCEVRGNFYQGGAANVTAGIVTPVTIDTTLVRDIVLTHQASVATMSAVTIRSQVCEIVRP